MISENHRLCHICKNLNQNFETKKKFLEYEHKKCVKNYVKLEIKNAQN